MAAIRQFISEHDELRGLIIIPQEKDPSTASDRVNRHKEGIYRSIIMRNAREWGFDVEEGHRDMPTGSFYLVRNTRARLQSIAEGVIWQLEYNRLMCEREGLEDISKGVLEKKLKDLNDRIAKFIWTNSTFFFNFVVMFYIVETQEQLDRLAVYKDDDCFIHTIMANDDTHHDMGMPSLVYYRPLSSDHGYILPIYHTECATIVGWHFSIIAGFLNTITGTVYGVDRESKSICLYVKFRYLKIAYTLSNKPFPDLSSYDTPAHTYVSRTINSDSKRYGSNTFVPISKQFEKWESIYDDLDFSLEPPGMEFYQDIVMSAFIELEKRVIMVDRSLLMKHYPSFDYTNYGRGPSFPTMGFIYPIYNLHNPTARPSCNSGGINMMALPKGNGARSMILPICHYLVEFDYKSYQIRLLADLIGYNFDSGNIHEELAKQYFNTDTVTPEQYEEGKKMTFRHSYGRSTEPPDSPFFKEVYAFRDGLWSFNQQNGYIISPISGRRLYGITKLTQVLPHLMQCLETERNALVLQDIHTYLKGKRSLIILYQYDSFLFDVHFREGTQLVGEIKDILEKDGYQTTVSFGYNYHEMNKTIIS